MLRRIKVGTSSTRKEDLRYTPQKFRHQSASFLEVSRWTNVQSRTWISQPHFCSDLHYLKAYVPHAKKTSHEQEQSTSARGKKVICYNAEEMDMLRGHDVVKNIEIGWTLSYFKDSLRMEAKEKGDVLDVKLRTFLDVVEMPPQPYDQPRHYYNKHVSANLDGCL
ncbi:hypothetical protein Tco_0955813 [Tanacetum coccineum]|uniref:Uncharacterized protein n=1 Tax=Tanacetum coccineum TaxID=301880 RepID=A0ABQ5E8A0_9ASTR